MCDLLLELNLKQHALRLKISICSRTVLLFVWFLFIEASLGKYWGHCDFTKQALTVNEYQVSALNRPTAKLLKNCESRCQLVANGELELQSLLRKHISSVDVGFRRTGNVHQKTENVDTHFTSCWWRVTEERQVFIGLFSLKLLNLKRNVTCHANSHSFLFYFLRSGFRWWLYIFLNFLGDFLSFSAATYFHSKTVTEPLCKSQKNTVNL